MNKLISMLLAIVMCLFLFACADSQQAQTNNKIDNDINIIKADVVGTWIDLDPTSFGMKMVIAEDGTGSVTSAEEVIKLNWERTDDTLTIIANSKEFIFKIDDSDGVVELLWQGDFIRHKMVSEKDYNRIIEIIEINTDNWQDYLEVKPYVNPKTDASNEISDLMIGCALVLKDEYASRICAVDCTLEYSLGETYICPIEYNTTTNEYLIRTAYTQEEAESKGYFIASYTYTDTDRLGKYSAYGFKFGTHHGCNTDTLQRKGDVVSAETEFYGAIEITNIQGNFYFKR